MISAKSHPFLVAVRSLHRHREGAGLTLPIKNYVLVMMFTVQTTRP